MTKRSYKKQTGFSVVETLAIVAILILMVFVGWKFLNPSQAQTDKTSANTSVSKEAPVIESESDLNVATQSLDDADSEKKNDADSKTVDRQLNSF